jgi:hypothetical protein
MTRINAQQLNERKDFSLIAILLFICMVERIMPIVGRAISSTVTTYFMMAVIILAYIIFLSSKQQIFISIIACFLPIIALELIGNLIHGKHNLLFLGYGYLYQILPCLMAAYILIYRRRYCVSISKAFYYGIAITVITTIIGLYVNPFASRYLATVTDTTDNYFVSLGWQNVGGYNFIYMVVLLYPMIICAYKQKRIRVGQMTLIFIAILLMLIKAEYTTALLFFTISSVFLFFKKQLRVRTLIIMLVIVLLLASILSPIISDAFRYFASRVDSQTLSDRFQYMADAISGINNTSDVGNRSKRLLYSLDIFKNNPIVGVAFAPQNTTGGHSYILDNLASYGIIGGLAMFIIYRMIYVIFYKKYKSKPYWGYMFFSFFQTIILSLINTGNWLIVIGLGIPMIAYLIDDDKTMPARKEYM